MPCSKTSIRGKAFGAVLACRLRISDSTDRYRTLNVVLYRYLDAVVLVSPGMRYTKGKFRLRFYSQGSGARARRLREIQGAFSPA